MYSHVLQSKYLQLSDDYNRILAAIVKENVVCPEKAKEVL